MQTCPLQGYFSKIDITQLAEQLRNGKLTSKQITQASLESIRQLDAQVNAFCYINTVEALKQAEHADQLFAQGVDLGLLQGIPVAIKDNIETKHMPTTMGSALFKDYIPQQDADCVKHLKQAGAIIVGKTNTHEFAYGPTGDCSYHGVTHNPWDLTKISGGSSCGSAVAVATGMVPIAIGTDTGGSIRIPASLTGVIGFKPSYERLAKTGVYPLSQTLDHLGILGKTAVDIKIVFESLIKHEKKAQNISYIQAKTKVAWIAIEQMTDHFDSSQYEEIKIKAFHLLGNKIENLALDLHHSFTEIGGCFSAIQNAEAFRIHQQNIENNPQLFQTEVRERLLTSKHTTGWEYLNAMSLRTQYQQKMAKLFKMYDFLIMPTLPISATNIGQRYIYLNGKQINIKNALLSLTCPWNVLGFPACSIPIKGSKNMPFGLQVIAMNQEDDKLIQFIDQYCKP